MFSFSPEYPFIFTMIKLLICYNLNFHSKVLEYNFINIYYLIRHTFLLNIVIHINFIACSLFSRVFQHTLHKVAQKYSAGEGYHNETRNRHHRQSHRYIYRSVFKMEWLVHCSKLQDQIQNRSSIWYFLPDGLRFLAS